MRQSPNNRKALQTLPAAYYSLKSESLRSILELDTDVLPELDQTIEHYRRLNEVAEQIRLTTISPDLVEPSTYYDEYAELTRLSGERHYLEGEQILTASNVYDVAAGRRALEHLTVTARYTPHYGDLNALLSRAHFQSMVRVVVLRPASIFAFDTADFYHSLMSSFGGTSWDRRRHYYSSMSEARYPHYIVTMSFDNFRIDEDKHSSPAHKVEREVEVDERWVDGEKVKVYETVRATYREYGVDIGARGTFSIRLEDALSGRVISSEYESAEAVWSTRWAEYSGDKRALSDEQLNLVERQREDPPRAHELYAEFYDEFYDVAETFLRGIR